MMYDCDICQSAGSVTRWGYCEICGEDLEDPESKVSSWVEKDVILAAGEKEQEPIQVGMFG